MANAILIKAGSEGHSGGNVYNSHREQKELVSERPRRKYKKRDRFSFFAPNSGYKRSPCADPKFWIRCS